MQQKQTGTKNATGTDTSSFAKKVDLTKSNAGKLDIGKLKNVPTNLSNLKSKVDRLDVPVPVDLSKLTDVVKNNVVKKDVYNAKIKNIEDNIPDITNLATKTTLNTKIKEVKVKYLVLLTQLLKLLLMPMKIKYLVLVIQLKKTDYNTKVNEIEKKITDHYHDKYITTPEFNKFTAEIFDLRLKHANLASKGVIDNFINKTDFDNKLNDVTSNKNELN